MVGPLPVSICHLNILTTEVLLWYGVLLALTITLARFVVICVWKSMRQMNDDLLVRLVVTEVIFLSCYFSSVGPSLVKTQNLALCIGNFDGVSDDNEWQWHGDHLYYSMIFGTCIIITIVLVVIIQVRKHQISQDVPVGIIQRPKNLDCTVLNLLLITLVAISGTCYLLFWMK